MNLMIQQPLYQQQHFYINMKLPQHRLVKHVKLLVQKKYFFFSRIELFLFNLNTFFKENKSIRIPTKRNTRLTQKRPPCADMSITPESPNKMTTRSQVRSNNTSLNYSIDTEIITKRERQRKSQINQRTPGLFVCLFIFLNIIFFLF